MRLIHYTLRSLFIPMLAIFACWGGVFYLLILHEVNDETDDTLENYKEIIIRSALTDSTLLKNHASIMSRYYIREVPKKEARLNHDEFYDSTEYIEIEKENEPVRVLRTYFMTARHKYYELTISISTLEKEDMVETTVWSMLVLYILLLGCVMLVIHHGFRKTLTPLYKLLDWLKNFQIGKTATPLNNPTQIEEFKILNDAAQESFDRSNNLYNRQKQFVENVAHELQTPLAICMNKLELLSENPDCTETQLQEIGGMHHTLSNIIRLNRTLLLLSRIENRQFPETRKICVNSLIHKMTEEINDVYEDKAIKLQIAEEGTLVCDMNESLTATLIANLLKNAYVHNQFDGTIEIKITPTSLSIANTGEGKPLDVSMLYGRFVRQSRQKESTGLGLAIVKSIADLYSISIDYQYEDKTHKFLLKFH